MKAMVSVGMTPPSCEWEVLQEFLLYYLLLCVMVDWVLSEYLLIICFTQDFIIFICVCLPTLTLFLLLTLLQNTPSMATCWLTLAHAITVFIYDSILPSFFTNRLYFLCMDSLFCCCPFCLCSFGFFFLFNSWLSCIQSALVWMIFFLCGLIATMLHLEGRFWARPCRGWNWQAGKWATVSRRKEGGRAYELRQRTHSKMLALSHVPAPWVLSLTALPLGSALSTIELRHSFFVLFGFFSIRHPGLAVISLSNFSCVKMVIFLWVVVRWRTTNNLNPLMDFLDHQSLETVWLSTVACPSMPFHFSLTFIPALLHFFSFFLALILWHCKFFVAGIFTPVVCSENLITVFLLGAWNKLSLTKSRLWDFLKTFQNVYFYQCVTCLLWFHSREYNILIRNCKKKRNNNVMKHFILKRCIF